ncbi:MAG: NADH-ubiquinone/plastoquinone oxidoreductase chain 6 [Thermoleophilia bacterium]|nr:NADH-ubiquinone/plastoquinone oxidoreductase chain 6 [Thermoleophilia bacterium]MCZ4496160.1 NADH-ubiquinone/plastoquinone oxidoreductase chain 6 [Thermoleophilia bacterium]
MNPLEFDIPGAPVEVLLFAMFSLTAIVGALRVVMASDPFHSALSLLFNFVSLGALYLMLDQPFVALAQILVYAGAVVVLFLFVIAYLGDRRELATDAIRLRWLRPIAALLALSLATLLVGVVIASNFPNAVQELPETGAGFSFGSAQAIGEVFLTDYVLAFEITSVVLLVAAIGGIILGLTGRARHERMRKLMQTRSADQQKKSYDQAAAAAHRDRELNS